MIPKQESVVFVLCGSIKAGGIVIFGTSDIYLMRFRLGLML